jgi:hypothetical protein
MGVYEKPSVLLASFLGLTAFRELLQHRQFCLSTDERRQAGTDGYLKATLRRAFSDDAI